MVDVQVTRLDPIDERAVAALADLRRAWTEEDAGEPIDDPAFGSELAQWVDDERSHRRLWLALLGVADGPCGMLNLVEYRRMPRPGGAPSAWGWVANVYVRPELRSSGIGRRLLDVAVDDARTRGLERLIVHPTERSWPFYRRAGFAPAADLAVLPLA